MKGVDAIAEILKREGVEFLVCYPRQPLIEAAAKAGADQIHETGLRVTSGGGASIDRCADLAVWLAGSDSDGLSGRMISAFTDDFESLSPSIPDIMASDLFTIRRVDPV